MDKQAKKVTKRIQDIDFNDWTDEFPGIVESIIQKALEAAYVEGFNGCESSLVPRAYADGIEAAKTVVKAQSKIFRSNEYAVGQPLSSFSERFACSVIVDKLENLQSTGNKNETV